ncbi:hypothetical protein ACH6CV_16755 [Bacillota bacterium Meth-B3]
MKVPQILTIALLSVGLVTEWVLDGIPCVGEHRFRSALINTGVWIGLLWWGGFFK